MGVKFRKLQCPYCPTAAKEARRSGTYRVIETANFFLLVCTKCAKQQNLLRSSLILLNHEGINQAKRLINDLEKKL